MTQEKKAPGKFPLHVRIFIGMGAGILLGLAARLILGEGDALSRLVTGVAQPVGQIFLRIIFMAVVPLVVAVLNSIGVPGEGIVIILGIDRLLDMARTVLNVTGDMTIAACVARLEPRGHTGR